MAYQATRRLRLGDRQYHTGQQIPESLDRDWALLVRRGHVIRVPDEPGGEVPRDAGKSTPKTRQTPAVVTVEELEPQKRAELDAIAAGLGVEKPGALPNKDAVIEAILAKQPN